MKRLWYAFWMCWGMFCAIPCPVRIWDEKARPRMLSCLPLIGGVIGGLWACLTLLSPGFVRAFLLTAAPWLLSGAIHLDGFLDCCDAIFSRRELEKRQQILKDSHVGSFAVIGMVLLALLSFALWCESGDLPFLPLLLLPVAVTQAERIMVSLTKAGAANCRESTAAVVTLRQL